MSDFYIFFMGSENEIYSKLRIAMCGMCAMLCLTLLGCHRPKTDTFVADDVLAQVGVEVFTQRDLAKEVPAGTADSAQIANMHIEQWGKNAILYELAKRNVPNEAEIEQMVKEYRKTLTIYQYQQMLIEQRMTPPTAEEVRAFYDTHANNFRMTEAAAQGVLLVIPVQTQHLDGILKALHQLNDRSMEQIEKFCVQHAVAYDDFRDQWVTASELQKRLPVAVTDGDRFVSQQRFYDLHDSTTRYLLTITNYKLSGTIAPFAMVQKNVNMMLTNQKKMDFIRHLTDAAYEQAKRDGTIKLAPQVQQPQSSDTIDTMMAENATHNK